MKKEEVEEQKREFALPVQIGKVIFIDVADRIRAVGNVRAEQRVMITAEVEGQITEIAVEEGDKVRADDLLAQIDSREYGLEVEELESELAAAQEELNKAVKGLRPEEKETLQAWVKANESTLELSIKNQNRIQKLVREGVTAQSILDEADDKVRQAQEQLRQSSAELAA
ncbi:MAG TPA: biotin/lipoyl-binding protein, partial [Nitrospinaceae bacterium]|nr:biotin/lipoyl-binding protein [Nitrospinaceae bacterium]